MDLCSRVMSPFSITIIFTCIVFLYFVYYYMVSVYLCYCFFFFFFKQKTAYEMRISDWSSDVCSSDLSAMIRLAFQKLAPDPAHVHRVLLVQRHARPDARMDEQIVADPPAHRMGRARRKGSRLAARQQSSLGHVMFNALSVDVEDWFQVGAFESTIKRDDWDGLNHRVERNSDAVLALLEEAGVKATFFTLGWVAERYPALLRRIANAGHEIASHGYDHRRVFTFTPEEFRQDLKISRDLIQQASGKPVIGYRAPSFSIDARTPWAHPILVEEGYAYSSSVAPVKHDHYGWPDAPRFAF